MVNFIIVTEFVKDFEPQEKRKERVIKIKKKNLRNKKQTEKRIEKKETRKANGEVNE